MAAPTLCLYNKFGYCKFSERCRKHHVNENCQNRYCKINECRERHPKLCRYFQNYGRCKFSPCAFRHETSNIIPVNEEKDLREKLVFLENEIKAKDKKIEELATKISDLETKLSVIDSIKEKIEDHDKKFEKLLKAIDKTLEFFQDKFNVLNEDIDDLAVDLNDDIGNLTLDHEENSLEQTFKNPFLGFKCDFCEFVAKSERGLQTHKTRKHLNCEWCEFICIDDSEMKKHKMDKHTLQYSVELLQNCYL